MTRTISADVSDDELTSGTEYSDRYVYSNYFVPLLITYDDDVTPIVPFFVKEQLLDYVRYGGLNEDRLHAILEELDLPELWGTNHMAEARAVLERAVAAQPANGGDAVAHNGGDAPGDAGHDDVHGMVAAPAGSLEEIAHTIRSTGSLLDALEERLDEPGREVLNVASTELVRSAHDLIERAHAGGRNGGAGGAAAMARRSVLTNQDVELVGGLLQSTLGYGFLDRTRISPVGFAIGEHVYALGLAPGEEVVLEQKTFTKRQSTLEDQTESERQFDLELSSTFSTELQEGFERQRAMEDTWGLNVSHTGTYQSPISPYGQWNGSHTIAYSKNVTQSNQEARRRSVKDGQTASAKVSARYRTQHKTLFRVTTEQLFETTSKRTIRNPNRATPITLHYFKVLQRLRLRQERYGVRLCWAPAVKDPARTLYDRIQAGRDQIVADALAKLPPKPVEPVPNTNGGSTQRQQKTFPSELTDAAQHSWTNGQSSNYDVDVAIPTGWSWDGEVQNITVDFSSTTRDPTTYSGYVTGIPLVVDGGLRVRVHIGAQEKAFAPPIVFQVVITCIQDVVTQSNAAQDAAYQAALEDYRTRMGEWETLRDQALAQAQQAADEFEQQTRAQLSPVNEMVSQIIEQHFPPGVRDEEWEVEYWQRLFDWERASVVTYPSWWSSGAARDALSDPSDFMNASWAKLYLPVRVGMEVHALRWIHGKAVARPLSAPIEARFAEIVDDLRKFRADVIGAADEVAELERPCQRAPEPFACLAEWSELMPTDGTHVEVVQGLTSGADAATAAAIEDAGKLRDKAVERMTEAAHIKVRVREDELA